MLGIQTLKVFSQPLLVGGQEQPASRSRGSTALASHQGDYHPPAVTYFTLVFAKSLLFPGIDRPGVCAWGWGQNLLSGQGLKSFVSFIPEVEERGGLIARLGPGHICPGQSIMVMVCLTFTALWTWNSLLLRGETGR